jgi:hypothetical protein
MKQFKNVPVSKDNRNVHKKNICMKSAVYKKLGPGVPPFLKPFISKGPLNYHIEQYNTHHIPGKRISRRTFQAAPTT